MPLDSVMGTLEFCSWLLFVDWSVLLYISFGGGGFL